MELLARLDGSRILRGRMVTCAIRAVLGLLPLLVTLSLFATTTPSKEYQLKAVFLFNFAMFVDWPSAAFPEPTTPFVIGVLGDDPFGPYLEDVVRGELVGNRPVEVHRYREVAEINVCHVLFISLAEARRLKQIGGALRERRVLTVGETDEFLQSGGVIAFAVRGGKIRLKINVDAARASELTVSSKLLRVAEVVESGRQ